MTFFKLKQIVASDGKPAQEVIDASEEVEKLRWDAYAEGRKDEKQEHNRKPLRYSIIRDLYARNCDFIDFARAIEKKHKIVEDKP